MRYKYLKIPELTKRGTCRKSCPLYYACSIAIENRKMKLIRFMGGYDYLTKYIEVVARTPSKKCPQFRKKSGSKK